MKSTVAILLVLLLLTGMSSPLYSAGRIKVVTSTLDFADIVNRIGGDRVDVYPIFRGLTDVHFFEPVPSQVIKLKKADMLVVLGLDADIWVKSLIDASRNAKVKFGANGYVDPSDGITPIQVPTGRIDGAMGDVHPYGNPHYWFTPDNLRIAVNNIYKGLARVSPKDEEYFAKNRDAYLVQVDKTFEEIASLMAPFKGTGVIEYHQSWDYFCDFMGLKVVATLEPKPGIPPSAKHLKTVVQLARGMNTRLMLVEPYYPEKPVKYVQHETGIKVLRLPIYLTPKEKDEGILGLLLQDAKKISEALSSNGS